MINSVVLVARLCNDPDLRFSQGGKAGMEADFKRWTKYNVATTKRARKARNMG